MPGQFLTSCRAQYRSIEAKPAYLWAALLLHFPHRPQRYVAPLCSLFACYPQVQARYHEGIWAYLPWPGLERARLSAGEPGEELETLLIRSYFLYRHPGYLCAC